MTDRIPKTLEYVAALMATGIAAPRRPFLGFSSTLFDGLPQREGLDWNNGYQPYKPGYRLAKAGVMLLALQDSSVKPSELDLDDPGPDRGKLMGTLDAPNTRYGRRSIQLASIGVGGSDRTWTMRQELKTPNYTTCWKDLPRAGLSLELDDG